jgi:hypothetical protein
MFQRSIRILVPILVALEIGIALGLGEVVFLGLYYPSNNNIHHPTPQYVPTKAHTEGLANN